MKSTTEDTETTEAATPETDALWHLLNTGDNRPSWWVVAEKMRDHSRKIERERDEARELAVAYKEYAQLLGDQVNSMATVAHFHGWKSSRVEQGKMLRDKIKQLEEVK